MVVIGLTGGTATGKSTVAAIWASMGARIIDADEAARELVKPGSDLLKKIADTFGQAVINDDGSLNRRELGRICFSEKQQLLKLNAIMHPRLRAQVEAMVEELKRALERHSDPSGPTAVVIDAAVLFESGLRDLADVVVAVVADPEIQVRRLVQRMGLSEGEARARVGAQRSNEEFARLSDFVIDTTGGLDSYEAEARALYRRILAEHGR
jgi:dephospho-CoA kinase